MESFMYTQQTKTTEVKVFISTLLIAPFIYAAITAIPPEIVSHEHVMTAIAVVKYSALDLIVGSVIAETIVLVNSKRKPAKGGVVTYGYGATQYIGAVQRTIKTGPRSAGRLVFIDVEELENGRETCNKPYSMLTKQRVF